MQGEMNAIVQSAAAAECGSKLDNRRMLAALIDLAIVGVGGAAILIAGGSAGAPLAGVIVCWALYYYFACESGSGQTLGKKLMRVRVVRVDGSAPDMREIAVRTALRVVDTALVGLIAILVTGERRARLGDLAAGTMIVSTEAATAPAPDAATAADAPAPAASAPAPAPVPALEPLPAPSAAPELRPFEPFAEPAMEYEPIARLEPVSDAKPAVDVDDAEPVTELFVVEPPPRVESASDEGTAPTRDRPSAEQHTLDVATPALTELARDVAALTGSGPAEAQPVVDTAPLAEVEPLVEVGGPELDVDGPDVTVHSVETVSAIDLIMGESEPSENAPAGDDPPAVA
jgi:uncharacterized RDD family membrane protein YckC